MLYRHCWPAGSSLILSLALDFSLLVLRIWSGTHFSAIALDLHPWLNVMFLSRIRILITPLRVLAFIMDAIRTLVVGENAHPRGQIEF